MRTRTYSKYVRNLTPAEYKSLYRKNFGYDGYMREDLQYAYSGEGNHDARVLMIRDLDTKKIIAWALVQPDRRKRASVMLWVCAPYRRQGFGARLMKHARKIDPKPKVFPHDPKSGKFFNKVGEVRVAPHDRFWLKEAQKA